MKKHLLAAILLSAAVIGGMKMPDAVLAAEEMSVSQEEQVEGNWKYRDNEDGTVTLTGVVDAITDEEIVLPTSLGGKEVSTIGESFLEFSDTKSVIIPEGVTTLEDGAFLGCRYLQSVDLPDGLHTIANEVFWGCHNLREVVLPNSLITIGDRAFCECEDIEELVIPKSVTSIGTYAFSHCNSLKTLIIPDNITSITSNAFMFCQELVSLTISEGVETIGDYSFNNCTYLSSITIPETVESIGAGAFSNDNIKNIRFGSNVPDLDENSFENIAIQAYYPLESSAWTEDEQQDYGGTVSWHAYKETEDTFGNIYYYIENDDDTVTVIGCSNLVSGNLAIPAEINEMEVTAIADGAFAGCLDVENVVIPEGVTDVGSHAFLGCMNMESISLPKTVKEIKEYTFAFCSNLTTIELPENMTEIKPYTFAYCENLVNINIPDSITAIGNSAFYQCSELSEIDLPEGLIVIGRWAFAKCINLQTLDLPTALQTIEVYAFSACKNVTEIVIPQSVTCIGTGAFEDCDAMKSIIFEGSAFEIIDEKTYGTILFRNVYATAYYPAGDVTWTQAFRDSLGIENDIIWESYNGSSTTNPFEDVIEDAYYYDAVLWALASDVTSGVTNNRFVPDAPCTRAQAVTFIWRAMGSPDPVSTSQAFVDVDNSLYYKKAILWAVENNVAYGLDKTHFAPDATVTRGEFVTFLYRAMWGMNYDVENPFTDISEGQYYYYPVLWAYVKGIAMGYTNDSFVPQEQCSRGQVVSFLYRAFA